MKDNPTSALDAMLESDSKAGSLTVYPLTVARYGMLELVNSPFVYSDIKYEINTMVPSFYIMTHGVKDLKGYNSKNIQELKDKALEWSEDELEIKDVEKLIECITNKIKELTKVAPDATEDPKKKESAQDSLTTAG